MLLYDLINVEIWTLFTPEKNWFLRTQALDIWRTLTKLSVQQHQIILVCKPYATEFFILYGYYISTYYRVEALIFFVTEYILVPFET